MNSDNKSLFFYLFKNHSILQDFEKNLNNTPINLDTNQFRSDLKYYEKCLQEPKTLTEKNYEEIFSFIIRSLSLKNVPTIIDNSLTVIDSIISMHYLSTPVIQKNITNLCKSFLTIYKNYIKETNILLKTNNLITSIISNKDLSLINNNLYNCIIFLLLNIIKFEDNTKFEDSYQIRKLSKTSLNNIVDRAIGSVSIVLDDEINFNNEKKEKNYYYGYYDLIEPIYKEYLNKYLKYNFDKQLNTFQNEKGVDKGKYNWCFNCRNQAYFLSDECQLPICSRKCEHFTYYKEKLLNLEISYNKNDFDAKDDLINIIKLLSLHLFYNLEQCQYNSNKIFYSNNSNKKNSNNTELIIIDDIFSYFTELIQKVISKYLTEYKNNLDTDFELIKVIKNFVLPTLIEITSFNKNMKNLSSFQKNVKLFTLISNSLNKENFTCEIIAFINTIFFPFFLKNSNNNSTLVTNKNIKNKYEEYFNEITFKEYIIELFSSELNDLFFELYSNFDSCFYNKNTFFIIIEDITNIIYDNFDKKYMNIESNNDKELINKLKTTSINFIMKYITYLNTIVTEKTKYKKNNINNINNIELKIKNIMATALNKFLINQNAMQKFFSNMKIENFPQLKDFVNYKELYLKQNNSILEIEESFKGLFQLSDKEIRYKYNIPYFPIISQENKENILHDFFENNFSLLLNYDDFIAYICSLFLRVQFDNIMNLDKLSISNFFSSFSPFNIKVLNYYIESFNYKNHNIIESLHMLFYYLPQISNTEQIIDKILQVFSKKYIKDNFNENEISNMQMFVNDYIFGICKMIMELSSNILNKNIAANKSVNEYISNLNKDLDFYKESERIDILNYSYIYDIYNETLNNPIDLNQTYTPQISVIENKFKKGSVDNIAISKTLFNLEISNKLTNNKYRTKNIITTQEIRDMLECSWGYFLGIFSKQISNFSQNETCVKAIDNILLLSKITGMLESYTISDAFLNSIINNAGINDSIFNEINSKNLLAINFLFTYVKNWGKYIFSSWFPILHLASQIFLLKKGNCELIYKYYCKKKNFRKIKNYKKIFGENSGHVEIVDIEIIFKSVRDFGFEIYKELIINLMKVIEEEIPIYNVVFGEKDYNLFSFDKLIFVIETNYKIRTEEENEAIYKILNEFFIKIIREHPLNDLLLNKVNKGIKIIDNLHVDVDKENNI